MNNEELSRFLQDLTYTHRQVEAVLAQGYSINAFWAGFIVALLLCIALFFLIRYIERNGEKATLFATIIILIGILVTPFTTPLTYKHIGDTMQHELTPRLEFNITKTLQEL